MKKLKGFIPAIILGLSFFAAIYFVQPIGVSTEFSVAAGSIERVFNKDLIYKDENNKKGYGSSNAYLNSGGGSIAEKIEKPFNYGNIFVLSIILGAFIASRLDPKRKEARKAGKRIYDELSDNEIVKEDNKENWSGYGKSFIAGFILLFGARMAGGCTSGHMMSGLMQSSVAGFFFAASVFAAAIPVALYLHRKKG